MFDTRRGVIPPSQTFCCETKLSNATDNRRKFARYPAGNVQASITCHGDTFAATVFDESIGGLCLIVDGRPAPKLFVGDEVGVNHRDENGTAYVRSSQQIEGAQVRLGLSWDPPRPDEIPDEDQKKKPAKPEKPKANRSNTQQRSVEPIPQEPAVVVDSAASAQREAELSSASVDDGSVRSQCDTASFDILEQVFYTHGDASIVCNVVGIGPNGQVRVQINEEKTFLADGRKLITRNRATRLIEISNEKTLKTLGGFYQVEPTADAILAHEFS